MRRCTLIRFLPYSFLVLATFVLLIVGMLQAESQGESGEGVMDLGTGVEAFWTVGGKRKEAHSNPWRASWIWMDEESDAMLARRSFSLDAIPRQARLRITATSQYELYVNSRYVSRGPARSAPHHQSYDEFDIMRLLRRGPNVLAVRVHYRAGGVSYHHQERPGLLVQVDFSPENKAGSIVSGSSWKVRPDTSWEKQAPLMSRFHLEVCDRVDLRGQVRDWNTIQFDDSSWDNATLLIRNVGWPSPQSNARPQPLTPPWTSLIRRDIPYLQETEIRGDELIEAVQIESEEPASILLTKSIDVRIAGQVQSYRRGSGALMVPAADSKNRWFLLFDFGEVMNGRPKLEIEGPEGTVVRIHCAPYLLNDRFTARIVDSELIDRVVLSGRRDQWEAMYFKPTRYLGIEMGTEVGPVDLHFAGIVRTVYPFEKRGRFQAPGNEWLETYWEAAAKTIQVCTTDAYTDNYRERRQYAQTGYYAALGNAWTFGDTALQRRYLTQIAQEQEANGLMPAYAPRNGNDYMVILDSNCLWVRGLHNYLLFSGDEETARSLLPVGRKLLNLLLEYTNEFGLIENPPYAYWIDHAVIDRRGANFALNGHFLGALEDFAETLEWLGEPGGALFRAEANQLRSSLRERFWNPDRELFCDAVVDGKQSQMFSEQTNALALALDVADPEQKVAVARQLISEDPSNYVQTASGITMVTPAMSYFLHRGLCRSGYVKQSLAMLRARFDKMLHPDSNQTLWEEWWLDGTGRSGRFTGGRTRSDAQTESAFPPALLGEYLLGVKPIKPGLREVILSLPESGVAEVAGAVPSPSGVLSVRWKVAEDGSLLDISIPADMNVRLDVKSLQLETERVLFVDDQSIDVASIASDLLTLGEGDHQIRF